MTVIYSLVAVAVAAWGLAILSDREWENDNHHSSGPHDIDFDDPTEYYNGPHEWPDD